MNKHILLVDDEVAIRSLLTQFLTDCGYRVTAVSSPSEARKAVARDAPQLVISDLQLEDSDGLDLLVRMKADLPDTPMMLLTGMLFDARVVEEVLSQKVSAYLPKTTSLAQIEVEVRRLIGPP
jgi:DNA-binding NtrC family response regulator